MSSISIPADILDQLALADPSWRASLHQGLVAVAAANPGYLPALAASSYLPNGQRLFAAFAQPLGAVRYVLVGEGPYPRAASATGVCFMDGAVGGLWSEEEGGGLAKAVNRATSLRNFMKMLLVADGRLTADATAGAALAPVALAARGDGSILTLAQLQANLHAEGFLLLNAALAFRADVKPALEAKAWLPFFEIVLAALAEFAESQGKSAPTLVLWGKIAEQVESLPVAARLPKIACEHPYNLSFINNAPMQALFGPMRLLTQRQAP